jgi:hypothetical protein
VTLETYLMQHHVWLTSNAKTLLVLLPAYPKCNLVVTTVLFVYLSRQLYHITMSLRGMLLPDDRRRCLTGTLATLATLAGLYGLGALLAAIGLGFASAALLATLTSAALLALVHRRLNLNLWGQVRSLGLGGGPSGSGGLTNALRAPSSPDSLASLGRILGTLLLGGFLLSLPLRPAAPSSAATGTPPHNNLAAVLPGAAAPPAAAAAAAAPTGATTEGLAACLARIGEGAWACPSAGTKCAAEEEVWAWGAGAEGCGFRDLAADELLALYAGKVRGVGGCAWVLVLGWRSFFVAADSGTHAHQSITPTHNRTWPSWATPWGASTTSGCLPRWATPPP